MGPPNTNPSNDREEDLNPGPPDYESSVLTTRPRYFLMKQSKIALLSDKLWNRILCLCFEVLLFFVVKLPEASKSKFKRRTTSSIHIFIPFFTRLLRTFYCCFPVVCSPSHKAFINDKLTN